MVAITRSCSIHEDPDECLCVEMFRFIYSCRRCGDQIEPVTEDVNETSDEAMVQFDHVCSAYSDVPPIATSIEWRDRMDRVERIVEHISNSIVPFDRPAELEVLLNQMYWDRVSREHAPAIKKVPASNPKGVCARSDHGPDCDASGPRCIQ